MWNLPRLETEPMSPALSGRFLSTAPPGKSPLFFRFFFHTGHYRVLSRIPCIVSRSLLVICFIYSCVYISQLFFLMFGIHSSELNHLYSVLSWTRDEICQFWWRGWQNCNIPVYKILVGGFGRDGRVESTRNVSPPGQQLHICLT